VTHPENEKLADLTLRERVVFAPLIVLIFWLGLYPQPVLDRMAPALDRTVQLVESRRAMIAERDAAARLAPVPAPPRRGASR
jgi:NADH-quinone oxidoreductase subunit M